MSTYRASFLIFATFAVVIAPCAQAQQTGLRCERVDTTGEIRAESLAELLPDVVLRCSATGSGVASYQVIVNANTSFANRDVAPIPSLNWAWNDAILIVGDPAPSRQVACVPAEGQTACPITSNANVFQGKKLEDASLVFQGVLIPTPESGRTVTLRISNLRVNAANVAGARVPEPVTTSVQMFGSGGGLVLISNAERVSATTRSSMRFGLRNAEGLPAGPAAAAVLITPRTLPLQNPDPKFAAQVSFSELFPRAFRRRNAGTTADDPRFLAAQSLPGASYNTETGFYNPAFPRLNRLNETGLADTSTRLVVQFEGIPENTALWVSIRDNSTSTSPRALLSYTDSNGAGAFNPMSPWVPGWAQLYRDNGKATAAWEIVGADPEQLEEFSFGVTLTALNGNPGFGVVKATGLIGPVGAATSMPAFRAPTAAVALPVIEVATSVELPRLSIVSSASLEAIPLAPDSLATAISSTIRRTATVPEPGESVDSLQGVTVEIIDSLGRRFRTRALAIAPGYISFLTPSEIRPGPGVVNLSVDGSVTASESVLVETVAPALFSTTGDGLGFPAGEAVTLGGGDPPMPLARLDEGSGKWVPRELSLADGAKVYVTVLATGLRNRSSVGAVSATIGGKRVPAILASAHPQTPGVDSVTVGPLPEDLAGSGLVKLSVQADGKRSQELTILIR